MIRVGAIGYRNHAARIIKLINASQLARVDRVYHPTHRYTDEVGTNELDDLLACDAVCILSPNGTHFDYLQYLAANFSGYIFCEKPPVDTLDKLDRLKLPAERTFFNFNFRFSSLRREMQSGLEDGLLGQPVAISVHWTHGLAFKDEYVSGWRAVPSGCRSSVLETQGIHWLDLVTLLFGKAVSAQGSAVNMSGRGTTDDTCRVSMQLDSGASADILVSYAAPVVSELSVLGTDGIFLYRDNEWAIRAPRDVFDSSGKFAPPPVIRRSELPTQSMYRDSLEKSLEYFLTICDREEQFEPESYLHSIATNRLLLNANVLNSSRLGRFAD